MKSSTLFVPLLAAASAYAHGFLATMTIAGKAYKGNVPNGPTNPSVIRQVADVSPVKGADNPAVNCGLSAKPASLVANANPGDQITFDWRGGDYSFWPHNTGPMLTYMASCGDQTCDKFNSQSAKWFKIEQIGKQSNGQWAQASLMSGGVATVNLPSNIAPGNYMIRHEIIALHLATEMGGAEFYPACAQLTIGGNGNGQAQPNELVSFPGGYSDSDPGIYDPSVFDDNAKYDFPGPPIAAFVSGGGGSSGSSGSSGSDDGDNTGSDSGSSSTYGGSATATTTSKGSRPTSNASNSGSSGSHNSSKCRLRNKPTPTSTSNYSKRSETSDESTSTGLDVGFYPKHISRVMRNLVFSRGHKKC